MTAEQIKTLREQTGAGMMDCKKALIEAAGDMDKAIDVLRKKGMALAAKKASRIAAEGLLGFAMTDTQAVLVEVNCETDFVAKNPDFVAFCDAVAKLVLGKKPANVESLFTMPFAEEGVSVEEKVQQLTAKIGEKISLRRFATLEKTAAEAVVAYLHPGNRIGVMLRSVGIAGSAEETSFLRDVAMHIAAMSPQYLRAEDVPNERLQKEQEIFTAQVAEDPGNAKKPAEIRDKIIQGKLAKFKKEVSLLEQVFVKDPDGKKTVGDWSKTHFSHLKLVGFVRYQVGEGIEKKSEDFAAEVARQVAGSKG